MKSLDFDTRSLIAKECINRVCEAAGLKTIDKKRRTDKRIARMLADSPSMGECSKWLDDNFLFLLIYLFFVLFITPPEHAGVDVNLSITSAHLNLIVCESGDNLAKHEMPNISFASGGDTVRFLYFVQYVSVYNNSYIIVNIHRIHWILLPMLPKIPVSGELVLYWNVAEVERKTLSLQLVKRLSWGLRNS